MLERKIVETEDRSHSIFIPDLNEQYHSKFGAIAESIHIFIQYGLYAINGIKKDIHIFEMGFGTGLNAFLTCLENKKLNRNILYEAIEAFPLNKDEIEQLNYPDILENREVFNEIHQIKWNNTARINKYFQLLKIETILQDHSFPFEYYDLVYFDAFAPQIQPELWTKKVFDRIFRSMKTNGILVTYSTKGSVKRALKSSGFSIELLTGPVGKREVLRAIKI